MGVQTRGRSTVCVDDPWSGASRELLGGCSGPRAVHVDDLQSEVSHVAGATAAECVGQSQAVSVLLVPSCLNCGKVCMTQNVPFLPL